jgi:hypothetical protein
MDAGGIRRDYSSDEGNNYFPLYTTVLTVFSQKIIK